MLWIKKHDKKLIIPKWGIKMQIKKWFGITISLGLSEIRLGVIVK